MGPAMLRWQQIDPICVPHLIGAAVYMTAQIVVPVHLQVAAGDRRAAVGFSCRTRSARQLRQAAIAARRTCRPDVGYLAAPAIYAATM